MSTVQKQVEASDVRHMIKRARKAAHVLATLSGERRNEALIAAANAIEARAVEIQAANDKDCAAAQKAVELGELRCRFRVFLVRIRVQLLRKLAISLLDVFLACAFRHPQHLVGVAHSSKLR